MSEASARRIRILAFCDSPTLMTGFARVANNVLADWASRPDTSVHCWAVNFSGWDYEKAPCRLFPAGGHDWNSPGRLSKFLEHLAGGDYTHVWLMMDPDALSLHGFPQKLRQLCKAAGVRVMLYFPVDARLDRPWLEILSAVDAAVTYTAYGRDETRRALAKSQYPVAVVGHGVEDHFKPLTLEERQRARHSELQLPDKVVDFVKPDTFLMLNVNKNEWRKDPLRSLEILVELRRLGVPAKLILRMAPTSSMGGVALDLAAEQLGLTYGVEWCHIGPVPEAGLVALYNTADLYLTTSMGEGWGLGVTEAMACHCPVAMMCHTSLAEIGTGQGVIWLPPESGHVCGADTRLRRRVDAVDAAGRIAFAVANGELGGGLRRAPKAGHRLTWPAVAAALFEQLTGKAGQ